LRLRTRDSVVRRTATASDSAGKHDDRPPVTAPSLGEEMLDEALAGSSDGAFVVGPDGRIALWNRSAAQILGYTAHEVIGRACCDVLAGVEGDGSYRGCHERTRVETGEPVQTFDMEIRAKTGAAVWINVSTLILPPNGQNGPLAIHLFRDVTKTKALLSLVQQRLLPPDPDARAVAQGVLTRRELELLRLMTLGLNTAAAAQRLGVSPATIRNHVQNIFGKLGVHSRLEAVAYARRYRLL
jgi:PAS domain S-box-containing protein